MRNKWVSVTERLPDPSGSWVLVSANGPQNCMWFYNGEWSDTTCATAHNIVIDEITHWMELPEIIQGDKQVNDI